MIKKFFHDNNRGSNRRNIKNTEPHPRFIGSHIKKSVFIIFQKNKGAKNIQPSQKSGYPDSENGRPLKVVY